jgi:hypothetical protein
MAATRLGIPAPAQVNTRPDGRYRFVQPMKRIRLDGIEAKKIRLTEPSVVDGGELWRFTKRGGRVDTNGWRLEVEEKR